MQQSSWLQSTIWVLGVVFILAVSEGTVAGAAERAGNGPETTERVPVVKIEEVVVSATKTPVPVSHLTSAVEVITGEDLERRQIKTVVDALRLGQGLAVFSSGGPGSRATVRIRGADSDQTLVLLDGAIMNSATFGDFNFSNLTLDNIEKIEILRGAQSMVWGSDAMGGVINITTKRGRGTPRASAFFEYGSFNSLREGGEFSGQHGPIDFSFAASRWDFTGFSSVNFRRGAMERDAFRNWQASTRLGLTLPMGGRLDFNYRWLNSDIDNDSQSKPGFDIFKAKSTRFQHVFSGRYKQPITEWWEQILTLSRQTQDIQTQNGTFRRNVVTGVVAPVFFGGTTDSTDTIANRIEWQHNFKVGDPLLLTFGYQFREQLAKSAGNFPFPTKIVSSHAGFAQAQLRLWDRVFATAGFRQDEYNLFKSATTWRVTGGYLHKETGTKVRGSYATGFRSPDVNELFFPGFGNPNLKPEKSQSMDVGIDQYLFKNTVNLSATYFWNRFRNLVQIDQNLALCGEDPFAPGSGIGASCPLNVGLAKTQGVEGGFNYLLVRNRPLLESLELRGQYTYTLTRDLIRGTRLSNWPAHQVSAVVSYQPIDPLRLNIEFRFVSRRFNDTRNQDRLDSFRVFNLSADYAVNKHVQVFTRVENLFDENYEEVLLRGTPVRSIYGGVRVSFDVGSS